MPNASSEWRGSAQFFIAAKLPGPLTAMKMHSRQMARFLLRCNTV